MEATKLLPEQLNRLHDVCKDFVCCYYQDTFHKKGIIHKNTYIMLRYFNQKSGTNIYSIIDLQRKKFAIKKGKSDYIVELDLFSNVDVDKLSEKTTKCGIISVLKELESLGLISLYFGGIFYSNATKETSIPDTIRTLLQEDVNKVLLPGNKVVLDLYKQNPYFRMVLTVPHSGISETNLEDNYTTVINSNCVLFKHSITDIKVSNVIQGIPVLDKHQKYVSIYYEFFTSKYELTKIPVLVFIPVTQIDKIYLCNEPPTIDDLRKLAKFLNNNISKIVLEQDNQFLRMELFIEKCLCIEFLPTGVIKFPIPVDLPVVFKDI